MANHPHIGFRNAQETGCIGTGLLVVERHNNDRAFAFFQIPQTASELLMVEVWHGRLDRRRQIRSKLFEQAFFSLSASAQVEYRHAAGSQYEGCELFGFPQAARAKRFQRCYHYLLNQIRRVMFISQVPQTIEPNARGHPAEQLGFRFTVIAGADLPYQLGIVQFNVHQHKL